MWSLIKKIFYKAKKVIAPNDFQRAINAWQRDGGDHTLRLNYKLSRESVVLDLGGYKGEWADEIYSRYKSRILIFEPVVDFYLNIVDRFQGNSDIQVFNFGLASENKTEKISISENASSVFNKNSKSKTSNSVIKLISAKEFFKEHNIGHVDLLKINIEGGEYDLLEHLIGCGWITKVDNVQVQFHNFFPDAEQRMKNIQSELLKTHQLTYQYAPFVWENWERIK